MADPVNRKIEYRTFTTGSSTDPLSCHRSAFEGPILGTINEKIESYCLVLFIVHNSTRSVCSCSHDSKIRSLFVRNKPKRSLFRRVPPSLREQRSEKRIPPSLRFTSTEETIKSEVQSAAHLLPRAELLALIFGERQPPHLQSQQAAISHGVFLSCADSKFELSSYFISQIGLTLWKITRKKYLLGP